MLIKLVVSQRGVVFFRKQDDLDNDSQKELIQRLGQLAGKPATSGLHIHPVTNAGREHGGKDDEISVISSEQRKKLYKGRYVSGQSLKGGWHSDITFEPVPSDYAVLRLTKLPKTGGGRLILTYFIVMRCTNCDRHPVGQWIRSLRPHLRTISTVPGIPGSHIRPARIQPERQGQQLRAL